MSSPESPLPESARSESSSPEIGRTVRAGGIDTNVHVHGDPATQPV